MATANDNLTVEIPAPETTHEAPATTPEDESPHRSNKKYAGEFDSVEELEAQYQVLQKQQGQPPTTPNKEEGEGAGGDKQQEQQDDTDAPPADRDAAESALKGKGLDISAFEQEFAASGTLSEDSYKKLTAAGLTKEVVDSYIAGQTALAQSFVNDIYAIAGGQEGYNEMVAWARENLSPTEIVAFDKIANAGQKEMLELAVTGMVSRWKSAEGSTPELMQGRAGAGRGSNRDVFESPQQVVEAMRDKRYGKDPAYTRTVEDKMARSNVFGG